MPAITRTLGLVAIASSLVAAVPFEKRGAPSHWATAYLEDYDAYHLRYLALDCQCQHNTTFFEDCCHPLLKSESLSDRPSYCTPNTTEVSSASAWISSTSAYGAPTSVSAPACSSTASAAAATTDSASPAAATPAAATTTDSETPKAAYAQPTTTTDTYVAPTTTTQAYVAPTTTKTTQAAATTTASSNNGGGNIETGGYATFFYQGGQAGACGTVHSDSDLLIAIDQAWWSDFSQPSPYCGKWITIQNTNNGKTVTAMVADVCPTCVNGNSLDLSVGAFQAIASESDGMVPISWWWA